MTNPEAEVPNEIPEIPNDHLGAVAHLLHVAREFRSRSIARPKTTFVSKEGEKYDASADQVEVTIEDAANVKVWLKTHDKEIAMTIGGILLAAGALKIQKNRTQRKKMGPRTSTYRRPPRQ